MIRGTKYRKMPRAVILIFLRRLGVGVASSSSEDIVLVFRCAWRVVYCSQC